MTDIESQPIPTIQAVPGWTLRGFGLPSAPTIGRVHNIGLLGQQGALVAIGGSSIISGFILIVGSLIIQAVKDASADIRHHIRSSEVFTGFDAVKAGAVAAQEPSHLPRAAARNSHSIPTASKETASAQEWREVEAVAIRNGWSVSRLGDQLRLVGRDGAERRLPSISQARAFLQIPAGAGKPDTPASGAPGSA